MAAALAVIRLRLRRRLERESLDALLASLSMVKTRRAALKEARVRTIIRYVEPLVGRLPGVPNTCLYRSLARYALLRRAGRSVEFVAALPSEGPSEFGHAWVEVDGLPYDSADLEKSRRMVVTFRYPPRTESSQ